VGVAHPSFGTEGNRVTAAHVAFHAGRRRKARAGKRGIEREGIRRAEGNRATHLAFRFFPCALEAADASRATVDSLRDASSFLPVRMER
jgi:hypothetical protein